MNDKQLNRKLSNNEKVNKTKIWLIEKFFLLKRLIDNPSMTSQIKRKTEERYKSTILGIKEGTSLQVLWTLASPMDRGVWWLEHVGSQRVRLNWATNTFTFVTFQNNIWMILWQKKLNNLNEKRQVPWKEKLTKGMQEENRNMSIVLYQIKGFNLSLKYFPQRKHHISMISLINSMKYSRVN